MRFYAFFLIIISAAVGFVIGQLLPPFLPGIMDDKEFMGESSVIDTIPYRLPVPVDSVVIKYETVILPAVRDTICDTITCIDSAHYDSTAVIIPITQVEYKDSLYRAWVSGFHPQLDSIKISKITTVRTVIKDRRRLGVGILGGYGLGKSGLTPFVGVGVYYRIFKF